MWWDARSDAESRLQQTVQAMRDRYVGLLDRATAAEPTPIRGIGAGTRRFGDGVPPGRLFGTDDGAALLEDWHPLVLVDVAALPGIEPGAQRIPWESVLGSPAGNDLRTLEPTADTLVEPVGPVVAAVSPGAPASSASAGVATVGLPVTLTNPLPTGATEGFLTVAHGTPPGPNVPVSTQSAAGAPTTGTVVFHVLTAVNIAGGDDMALVALQPGSLRGLVQNSGVQPPPLGPPYPTLPVDLYAGQSGHVLAQVNGALLQHGDQTWQWLDCWELGGTTPGMRPGDSGSLALGPSAPHPIFGHFVGGAVNMRGPGFTHHWVQDLGRVLGRNPVLNGMIQF